METNQNQALSTDSSKPTTDQALRMITDLWGAMIALFGVRWSSQFGETPDASGQWRQTLSGISRQQVSNALNDIRMSGRAWPPTAPEFRSLCLGGVSQYKTVEAAYAEANDFMLGRISANDLSDSVRHTIYRNMDFYQYRSLSMEKSQEVFRFAYKATIEQFNSGEEPYQFPPPVLKIEEVKPYVSPEDADRHRRELLSMFDAPEVKTNNSADFNAMNKLQIAKELLKPKSPNLEDIKDLERVNKLKAEM